MRYIDFHTHRPVPPDVWTPRSFGIHPWEAATQPLPSADDPRWAEAQVIGECGLDALRGGDLDWQETVLVRHLEVAERLHRCVVLHCVREQQRLLRLRRCYRSAPWVLHGFAGGIEQARQLASFAITPSIGAALLDSRRQRLADAVRQLGAGAFLLETDDSGADIAAIYVAAASLLNIPVAVLVEAIERRTALLVEQP